MGDEEGLRSEAVRRRLQGEPAGAIAAALGRSKRWVYGWIGPLRTQSVVRQPIPSGGGTRQADPVAELVRAWGRPGENQMALDAFMGAGATSASDREQPVGSGRPSRDPVVTLGRSGGPPGVGAAVPGVFVTSSNAQQTGLGLSAELPAHLTTLLGLVPAAPDARARWQDAASRFGAWRTERGVHGGDQAIHGLRPVERALGTCPLDLEAARRWRGLAMRWNETPAPSTGSRTHPAAGARHRAPVITPFIGTRGPPRDRAVRPARLAGAWPRRRRTAALWCHAAPWPASRRRSPHPA